MKLHFILVALLALATSQLINAARQYNPKSVVDFQFDDKWSSEEEEIGKCGKNKYYLDAFDSCLECSQCGSGFYEREQCSKVADTICDLCTTENPIMNEDYFSRCPEHKRLYEKFHVIFKEFHKQAHEEAVEHVSKAIKTHDTRNWEWVLYSLFASIALASFILSAWMCCTRRKYTRVINIVPPQLTEVDDHNIIYAANHAREKVANKRGAVPYAHL